MRSSKLKIAVVQFNPVVGAISENCARILELYRRAADGGADLVVFPEMATTGYPIEDLAISPLFVETAIRALPKLQQSLDREAGILFGCLLKRDHLGELSSNGAFLFDPKHPETQSVVKHELPNYGVFDEKRVFNAEPLADIKPLEFRGHKLGVMICEDCWFPAVTDRLVSRGADILIVLNGSPYEVGKNVTRVKVAKDRLDEHTIRTNKDGECQLPFLYVNMVGGQDELVFDGGSFLLSQNGLLTCETFVENIEQLEIDMGYQPLATFDLPEKSAIASIYDACVLGLRDYARKQGFQSVVLGMSGGVDSGIVAALATDAIGPENVHLVRLPSNFSSGGSLTDAANANARLGTQMRTIAIEPVVNALRAAYAQQVHEEARLPEIATLTGVADENIQARARGNILMAISNQEGHLLLTTGNKSEVSVGYSTLYGDMAGGFNPIKDCYKTTVWDMCRYRNSLVQADLDLAGFLGRVGDMVPEEIIVKPPSAELRPDQQDSDSLPPYHVLDDILFKMIEKQMSVAEIVKQCSYDSAVVSRIRFLLDRAEYKRRQAAPGVKITSKLHGRERRVPIINHFAGVERDINAAIFGAA
jgi:NAD+ synthase